MDNATPNRAAALMSLLHGKIALLYSSVQLLTCSKCRAVSWPLEKILGVGGGWGGGG